MPGTHFRAPLSVKLADGSVVPIVNSSGVVTAALADTSTGSVTIATAKTLTVTDADALIVGSKIVPQTFFINISQAQFGFAVPIPVAWKLVSVRERHTVAESTAATLTGMAKKVASGTAPGSGTDMLSAGTNLKSTANTNVSGSLHATAANYTGSAGDGVAIIASASITELAGSEYTLEFQRV